MHRTRASKVVLAIAAFACIATSKKGWQLEAAIPPHAAPGPHQATRAVIEASRRPTLHCTVDYVDEAEPVDGTLAHGTYLCPPGQDLVEVLLFGRDSVGGHGLLCGGEPQPPDGVFVRVVSVASDATWTQDVETTYDGPGSILSVDVDSRYPFTARATYTANGATIRARVEPSPKRLTVYNPGEPHGVVQLTVTTYGSCAGAACTPPADASPKLERAAP